jgi:phosphonate transport system substrate-binding protein
VGEGKRKLHFILGLLLTLISVSCTATQNVSSDTAVYTPSRLDLIIAPSNSQTESYSQWRPLTDKITHETGIPVRLIIPNAYEEMLPMIYQNRPDLTYTTSLQYLSVHEQYGYEAFIGVLPNPRGLIFVRADSTIRTLDDLEGKTIAMMPPGSLVGHDQTKALLTDEGLAANSNYRMIIVQNFDRTLDAVLSGAAEAGTIADKYYSQMTHEQRAKIRVIATTSQLSPSPFAIRSDINPAVREKITAALLSLNNPTGNPNILKSLKWNELITVNDAAYDAVRYFADKYEIEY